MNQEYGGDCAQTGQFATRGNRIPSRSEATGINSHDISFPTEDPEMQSNCQSPDENFVLPTNPSKHDKRDRPWACSGKDKLLPRVKFQGCPPQVYSSGLAPVNAREQKALFFKCGIDPVFQLQGSETQVESIIRHGAAKINFHLINEAKRILDTALEKHSLLDNVIEVMYGKRITLEAAVSRVNDYILKHKLQKEIEVIWCRELTCSAQMSSTGPEARLNKPQERKYTLLVKSSSENTFLRENGIDCLMDHEIGTHFFRSFNDGYQVWYSDRKKFGLNSPKTYEGMKTEEGFACLNTLLNANVKYLCMPALLYYSVCLAEYLTFRELFQHLGRYVKSEEQRWKHCMRVKRGLKDVNQIGGYGKDQRYFEGAVEILRNMESIDFDVLIGGKVLWTETRRLQNIIRRDIIRYPYFMHDRAAFKAALCDIAAVNGIDILPPSNESDFPVKKSRLPICRGRKAGVKTILSLPDPPPCPKNVKFLQRAITGKQRATGMPSCGCALLTSNAVPLKVSRINQIRKKHMKEKNMDDKTNPQGDTHAIPPEPCELGLVKKSSHQIPIVLEVNMFHPIEPPPF